MTYSKLFFVQLKVRGDTIKEGDVFLSNHPQAGGSHLPDLTVITPVRIFIYKQKICIRINSILV